MRVSIAVAGLVVLARAARKAGSRPASIAVHSAFGIQILLGIATVMTGVDITLAVFHQLVGALLVGLGLALTRPERRVTVLRDQVDVDVEALAPRATIRTVAIGGDHGSLAMKAARSACRRLHAR